MEQSWVSMSSACGRHSSKITRKVKQRAYEIEELQGDRRACSPSQKLVVVVAPHFARGDDFSVSEKSADLGVEGPVQAPFPVEGVGHTAGSWTARAVRERKHKTAGYLDQFTNHKEASVSSLIEAVRCVRAQYVPLLSRYSTTSLWPHKHA